MLIIAFAWTTAAFEAGAKTCTRRRWGDEYASRFKPGTVCQGWDNGPRNGGTIKGLLRITKKPYKENTRDMPDEDFDNEGFRWMEEQGMMFRGITPRKFWEGWKNLAEDVYVVRFIKLESPSGIFYN